MTDTRTYRGATLEEILPQIRAELGDDAVVVARREHLQGGVGGFFAKREIEVDARPARSRLDVVDDAPAMPGVIPAPAPEATEAAPQPQPAPWEPPVVQGQAQQPVRDPQAIANAFAEQLAQLTANAPKPPAPAHEPVVSEQVAPAPVPEDAAPEATPMMEPPAAAPEAQAETDAPEATTVPEPLAPATPMMEPAPEAPSDADLLVAPSTPAPAPPAPLAPAHADDPVIEALVGRGLSPRFAREVRTEAVAGFMPLAPDQSPERVLRDALARRIPIASPKRGPHGGVVGFVGPGGSGKTRCVARLATAYATRSDLPVACLTLRAKDGGAELQRLLAPANVTVHAEDDAAAAAARVRELRGHALVVLDTPGLSPRAEAERRTLIAELRQLQVDELHVCVPATIGAGPARELAAAAQDLGADAIAITHADETEALGGAVELAVTSGLPLSFVARGTALESGLRPANADDLALALLP